jgi:DNA-binding protein HU-beta
MNKATIITQLAEQTGIERADVELIVENMLGLIQQTLLENEEVYLKGFGKFFNKKRAQKIARNIADNTSITIAAHYIPTLKMSTDFVKQIKERLTV